MQPEIKQRLEHLLKSGPQRIHLIGVCGSGMSGLARLLLAQGHELSGSDLVPAADDHQSYNARIFEQAGASRILVESKTTPETLHEVVSEILTNVPKRNLMAEAARGLAGVDAAKRVAEEIEASCNPK